MSRSTSPLIWNEPGNWHPFSVGEWPSLSRSASFSITSTSSSLAGSPKAFNLWFFCVCRSHITRSPLLGNPIFVVFNNSIYQHKLTNKHTSVSGISIFTIPNKKTKLHNFFESKLVKFTAFQNQSQGTHPSVLPCWWNRYHLCPTSWRLPGFSSNNSTSTLVTLPPFGGVESLNIKKGWVQCSKHNIWCWVLEKLWRIGLSPKQWWCVDAKLKHLMLSNVKNGHCQKAVVLCPPWFFVENSSTHPRISSLSL